LSSTFATGQLCLLLDQRGRKYLFELTPGGAFQYHAGTLPHDQIIGAEPGTLLRSTGDSRLVALRPRLADYLLKMPRGAQLIYPKDLGPMIHWTDVAPGHTVIEAGTGSGALTLALLRAVGPTGTVVTVERRTDHRLHAERTIARFLDGLPANLVLEEGDVVDVLLDRPGADRLLLDLPEPWLAVEAAAGRLTPDGVVGAYVPTVPQVQRLADALRRSGRFVGVETFEGLHREWRVDGRSVRPESQMVGHTGFITTARHSRPQDADDPSAEGSSDSSDR
jgi:tRNA (adenine57-N1/adenine58-N1)-methyltransferase